MAIGAAVLVVMGGVSLALRKRGLALGLLVVPIFVGSGSRVPLPPGFRQLDRSQSLLGLVEVIVDDNRGVRFLRSDHSVLGASYERGNVPAFAFVNVLTAIRFFRPGAENCLNIGLGTGAAPSKLEQHGIKVDVVEIDPAVVRFAREHFGFSPKGAVVVDDARAFLSETSRRYDLVIHDTFTGGTTPEHLLSVEVLERIRTLLRPGGVLALNLAGYASGPNAEATRAVARTVEAVFRHVRAYRDSAPTVQDAVGNMVFFASEAPLEFAIPPAASFSDENEERLVRSFTAWSIAFDTRGISPITDALNPLGRLQLPVAEKHFEAMNELLPTDVWLN